MLKGVAFARKLFKSLMLIMQAKFMYVKLKIKNC